MTDLVTIFYEVDNFCKDFQRQSDYNLLTDGTNLRNKAFRLSPSEIMTIMIYYHQSGYKTFKAFYEHHVLVHLRGEFPGLVSYNRFLELRKKMLSLTVIFSQLKALNNCSGVSFIDSFSLEVGHIKRCYSHKVFKGLAQKGKTSVSWFYGFKLHLVINNDGEIIAFCITPGNVADNNEKVLIKLTKKLFGKLFGDRGYLINQSLFEKLHSQGVQLITKIRKNMKNKLMSVEDKLLLRKRGIIESVGSILKEGLSLEHSRHRSFSGFICHVAATLISYNFREKKPSIGRSNETKLLVS